MKQQQYQQKKENNAGGDCRNVGALIHADRILCSFRCLASICLKTDNVLRLKVLTTVM